MQSKSPVLLTLIPWQACTSTLAAQAHPWLGRLSAANVISLSVKETASCIDTNELLCTGARVLTDQLDCRASTSSNGCAEGVAGARGTSRASLLVSRNNPSGAGNHVACATSPAPVAATTHRQPTNPTPPATTSGGDHRVHANQQHTMGSWERRVSPSSSSWRQAAGNDAGDASCSSSPSHHHLSSATSAAPLPPRPILLQSGLCLSANRCYSSGGSGAAASRSERFGGGGEGAAGSSEDPGAGVPGGVAGLAPARVTGWGSSASGRGEDEEFNFVQVGPPLRVRIPGTTPATTGTSPTKTRKQRSAQPPPTPSALAAEGGGAGSATSTPTDSDAGAAAADAAAAAILERIPLVPPHRRQQPPLPPRVSRELWRTAEELAGGGQLVRLPVGRGGLTRGLLAQAGELLERHELLRVYLLPNCELEIGFVSWVLEAALDCVALRTKGRTVTLYREHGLPRPPASFREGEEQEQKPARAQGGRGELEQAEGEGAGGADAGVAGRTAATEDGGLRVPAGGAAGGESGVLGSGDEAAPAGRPEAGGQDSGSAGAAGTGAAGDTAKGASSATEPGSEFASRFRMYWALREGPRLRLRVGRRQ